MGERTEGGSEGGGNRIGIIYFKAELRYIRHVMVVVLG